VLVAKSYSDAFKSVKVMYVILLVSLPDTVYTELTHYNSVIKINKKQFDSVVEMDMLSVYTVGRVVHTLPEGAAVSGVTSLGDNIYLLRARIGVEVYDVITYRFLRSLAVPNVRGFTDMTICLHYCCMYIADHIAECVHRVDLQGAATHWPVNDIPESLSVNAAHNVLVTCCLVGKLKQFSSHGQLVRQVTLPGDLTNPWHSIQLTSGQYVVCHGEVNDAMHRVCVVSADGRHTVHTHGGQPGTDIGQYDGPAHLAVDNNESVFVADLNNQRVTLLSPTLNYIRQVVSRDKLKWKPGHLHLDVQRRRLYVTDNEFKDGKLTSGRVVVFSV